MDSKVTASACAYCNRRRKPRGASEADELLPSCCLNEASSMESDLCCTEESWEKESPDPAAPLQPIRPISGSSCLGQALPSRVTAAERAPLRRPRPGGSHGAGHFSYCEPFEERVDSVMKLVQAQDKFCPARHPGEQGKPMFFSVSPFVADRRKSFVAWKTRMASYFGYSRDTVAVALNYFDRYTSLKKCNPTLAQAVAVTSLHIAAKFEEPKPAPLRDLLRFTPVFTTKQLLALEMSILKALNWKLRPVTVYDCIGGFCSLLVETRAGGLTPSSLALKEEKEKQVDQLRVLAEEIADLSLDDVGFVDFLPSTLATSALLLSVSHKPRPVSVTSPKPPGASAIVITHDDVLDTCCKTVAGIPSLQRVMECVRLLSLSFSQSYPAVAAAAQVAFARVTRYANRPTAVGGGIDAVLTQATVGGAFASVTRSKTPESGTVPSKGRRCCTPTGIEGIVHIENAAISNARTSVGEQGGSGRLSNRGQPKPANLVGASGVGEEGKTMKHTRPTSCPTRASRVRVGSLSRRDEGSVFAGTSKRNKRPAEVSVPTGSFQDARADSTTVRKQRRHASIEVSVVRKRTRGVLCRGPLKSIGDSGSSSSILRTCKVSSTEALGHCESGSGFGAPEPRPAKLDGTRHDTESASGSSSSGPSHKVDSI